MFQRARIILLALLLCFPLTAQAQDSGSAWILTFFNSPDFTTVVATSSVGELALDFRAGDAPAAVNVEQFSMRAQTQPRLTAGTYRFNASADDAMRLYVDGELLIDGIGAGGGGGTATTFLDSGLHTLSVEYVQTGGPATLSLSYQLEGGEIADAPVPGLPGEAVGQGQVFNVEGLSVRSGPYLGASRLEIIEPGVEFPVYARNTEEGEFTWYLVQVQDFIDVVDDITGETIRQPVGEPTVGWTSGRYFLINVPEAQVPVLSTPFESPNLAPTGTTGVTTSNLRLRQLPSYRTPTLATLEWGASLEILGLTQQANQPHWYFVRTEGRTGWVYAPYVNVIGSLEAVPLY